MCLFTGRVRLLTVFFSFRRFPVKQQFLPSSKPRFFNAADNGTPLILSLATPRAVDAIAFHSLGHNGNNPHAKRLNSPPTPYPLCIIVPEYTGTPLALCKHSTYWSHAGKYSSVIFLFKVKQYSHLTRRKWYMSSRAVRYVHFDCGKHMFCQRSVHWRIIIFERHFPENTTKKNDTKEWHT